MADSGGTTVTLTVTPGTPGTKVPDSTPPPSHIPFTGFELTTALVWAALLLALGSALLVLNRSRVIPVTTTSRRTP